MTEYMRLIFSAISSDVLYKQPSVINTESKNKQSNPLRDAIQVGLQE